MTRVDPPNSRGKLYLPENFFCATVFFELRKEDEKDFAALDELVEATMIQRFFGGIILRAETEYKRDAGKIFFRTESTACQADTNTSLAFWATSKSLKYR